MRLFVENVRKQEETQDFKTQKLHLKPVKTFTGQQQVPDLGILVDAAAKPATKSQRKRKRARQKRISAEQQVNVKSESEQSAEPQQDKLESEQSTPSLHILDRSQELPSNTSNAPLLTQNNIDWTQLDFDPKARQPDPADPNAEMKTQDLWLPRSKCVNTIRKGDQMHPDYRQARPILHTVLARKLQEFFVSPSLTWRGELVWKNFKLS